MVGIKPLKIVYLICVPVVIGLISPVHGKSQSMGNPAVLQQQMWSLGLAAEFSKYEMEGHEYEITRGLTKVDFSVYKNVDFALLLGMGTMDIRYPDSKRLTDFTGSNSFAVGGSLKLISDVPRLPMVKLFGEGGGLRQSPVGDVSSISTTDPGDFHLKFRWYEFWGSGGALIKNKSFDFYVGYQGRVNRQVESITREKFKSGLLSNIIAGIDFHLPQQFVVNIHIRVGNGSAASIGISQSGILTR